MEIRKWRVVVKEKWKRDKEGRVKVLIKSVGATKPGLLTRGWKGWKITGGKQ